MGSVFLMILHNLVFSILEHYVLCYYSIFKGYIVILITEVTILRRKNESTTQFSLV